MFGLDLGESIQLLFDRFGGLDAVGLDWMQ